ncbi:hypothetical protein QBC40DRAFT_100144 [Triangularia verruculosa]|uniref:Uncharacterized protein n=1 Tax=Triangularia verruculosa TaxID=2587418 RepID=A0AAN7AQW5_9PEZI|nr:hypothetical protein QBC40DRAFT_100144 [Triangularia verruculosa]
MADADKPVATTSENVVEKPRRRGCVGHCVRFWWVYLIVLVVLTVILVPVILLVAVPKIAQSKLDDAELILDGITVTNTESKRMTMAINSTIKSDGKVHATIEPFLGVMYLEDLPGHTPFASINFPETTSEALQTVNVTQTLDITDVDALTTFNTWLLANETLRVTVYGETGIHVKGISRRYPVTFKKTVEMPGLQMLAGTSVNKTTINLDPVNNFNATTWIPNRSKVSFELGNATFHNYLQGQEVGTVFIDNLFLRAGEVNEYKMRATIEQSPVLEALGKSPACDKDNGWLDFQIRGKTVTNNGQDLPYFANALSTANQTIPIDIGGTLQRSLGLTIPCGGLGGGDH